MINKRPALKQILLKQTILWILVFIFLVSIICSIFPARVFGNTYSDISSSNNNGNSDNVVCGDSIGTGISGSCSGNSNNSAIYSKSSNRAYKEANNELNLSAESAIVMDYKTGDIIWEKNSTKEVFPASTTKMITAIIAIENIEDYNKIVEISKNASGRNHSAFRFRTGDRISIMDLLKASLICSHNNAAIALAEYVSGNVEDFVELMNLKAREIGAVNSNFQNTNGLDQDYPEHKSTAYDLALIAKYCLKNDLFRKIVKTKKDYIKINDKEVEINTTNELLLSYDYIKGVKTGYTDNAGYCIVLYSDKNDVELITVILNCSSLDNRKDDSLKLLNWVYSNFDYMKIVDSGKIFKTINIGSSAKVDIDLYPDSDFTKLVNISSDKIDLKYNIGEGIDLPIFKNQKLGDLDIYINGEKQTCVNLISEDSIEKPYIYQKLENQKEIQSRKILIFLFVFYFFIFIFIIVRNLLLGKRGYS